MPVAVPTSLDDAVAAASEHPGALHLSADEAGALAAAADVGRLVLTHQAPLEDRQAHLDKAREKFSGPIVLAEVGRQYPATGW